MKNALIVFILFTLTSCKAIIIEMMLKDPEVENSQTIKEFQTKNNYSTENSLIIKADTSNAIQRLFLGLTVGYYIFDKDGNQICYDGLTTCHSEEFIELLNNKTNNFKSCKNDSVNLDKILEQTYDLKENPVKKSQFEDADYYVVSYWQKFLGGKRGYEDAVTEMEEEIEESNSSLKFTFIKINTDLQENWGLVSGGKAKLEHNLKGDMLTLDVTDLPIKR